MNMTITEFSECDSKKELLKMLSSVQIIWGKCQPYKWLHVVH